MSARYKADCRCCHKFKNVYSRGLCKWCFDRHKDEHPIIQVDSQGQVSPRVLALLPLLQARAANREPISRGEVFHAGE